MMDKFPTTWKEFEGMIEELADQILKEEQTSYEEHVEQGLNPAPIDGIPQEMYKAFAYRELYIDAGSKACELPYNEAFWGNCLQTVIEMLVTDKDPWHQGAYAVQYGFLDGIKDRATGVKGYVPWYVKKHKDLSHEMFRLEIFIKSYNAAVQQGEE